MLIRCKNWEEFQHYKDRDPPWIKLHKRLLDDSAFHRLPDASRALAPMLWLLCSETRDGTIKDATAEIAFRLRMPEKRVEDALGPLIKAGFFIVEQVASKLLAERYQDATCEPLLVYSESESESEAQVKTETEADSVAGATDGAVDQAFRLFNDAAKRTGWPAALKIDAKRRRHMRARLKEVGIDGFAMAIAKAEASDFLTAKWPLKIDWLLLPANFTKVIEGNYANPPPAESHDARKDREIREAIERSKLQ